MKVTAFVGSARKKHTYDATLKFLENLKSFGDVEYEIIRLSDHRIETCKGCKLCLDRGEELCSLKDDRDLLIGKMMDSDGVIFSSPNYSFQVSGLMKVFLDRLGFIFHRPRFFGRAFTSIVAQGIYGGDKITKYFNFIGEGLGFNVVKGSTINSIEPMTEERRQETDRIIEQQSKRFYRTLLKKEFPSPSLIKLLLFRMSRSSMKAMLDESWRDYTYYRDQGWFESDYYYPVKLNPIQKRMGSFFDRRATHVAVSKGRVGII